jgi:thiol-disulfide isomerase/thioredoxin
LGRYQHQENIPMVQTPSTMIPLGTSAPDFTLLEPATGKRRSLSEFNGAPATVVMFICNHCPFVIHVRDELTHLANDYAPKGVAFVAINSNSVGVAPAGRTGAHGRAREAARLEVPVPLR